MIRRKTVNSQLVVETTVAELDPVAMHAVGGKRRNLYYVLLLMNMHNVHLIISPIMRFIFTLSILRSKSTVKISLEKDTNIVDP